MLLALVYAAVCSRQWCDARSPRYSIPRTCTIFQDVPRFSTSARFVYVLGPERSGRRPKGTVVNFNVRRTNLALEFPPNSLYRAISALQDECFQEIMECSKVSECSKILECSKVNKINLGTFLETHKRSDFVFNKSTGDIAPSRPHKVLMTSSDVDTGAKEYPADFVQG